MAGFTDTWRCANEKPKRIDAVKICRDICADVIWGGIKWQWTKASFRKSSIWLT
jgi:hypothetical protein